MNYKTVTAAIQNGMRLLNFAAIVLICVVLCGSVQGAAEWQMARELAAELGQVPLAPWVSPLVALLGYGVLLFTSHPQHQQLKTVRTLVLIGCLELLASLLVIVSLHMAYNSILLIVVIDMVEVAKRHHRRVFLAGGVALYVITSLNVVRDGLGIISLDHYLTYYNVLAAGTVRDALALAAALNWVGFIFSMVLLLGHKTEENEKISQLNAQLVQMNQQLKEYATQSEHLAEMRERNRLAREIHDTLGHALTGIASAADACGMMLTTAPESAAKFLAMIGETARQGIVDVRRSVSALRPDALEHRALEDALRSMLDHIAHSAGADVFLYLKLAEKLSLSEDEEEALYRIVQEATTNAIRHGKATCIEVSLEFTGPSELTVQVKDNGTGMSPDAKEGFGLLHMRERLDLLGGFLHFGGDDGFILRAVLPLRKRGHADDTGDDC